MPIFEQYYFTFDTKQRVVASSRPQNSSTVESLCMASTFDSNTYSRSRQLMYDSYNDSFLFMETHRLRNTTEGRAVRFIHSYQLSEKNTDPRCYLAPEDFYNGEDGSFRNTADLPQGEFERSKKTVKDIALYYLSADPSKPESLDEVRSKLEKIISVLYKNVVFGYDKLLIHWVGKSDDELCLDGCDITMMMHLLTPPSRRKYLSADTNILGSTSLAKKLNFTNNAAALKNAVAIMEINNGDVNILRVSTSIEKVCELLVSRIAVAALTSDEALQELLEEFDEWLCTADTSAGDAFVNLGLYEFLGKGKVSPTKCDVDLSKFSKVIAPSMWQNSKDKFKICVQALLDKELSGDDIQAQKAAFDKVLSLAKQVEQINCKSGEYYEIFANALAYLYNNNADVCENLCKELKNLHKGINSAAERMINDTSTNEDHRELLKDVQSALIELPEKFKDREQLAEYTEKFPQLMGEHSPKDFVKKSVDLYISSADGKSVIGIFEGTKVQKEISTQIVNTLKRENVAQITDKVNRFIGDGILLDEEIKGVIVENLRRVLESADVSDNQVYAVIDIADGIKCRAGIEEDIKNVYGRKLKKAQIKIEPSRSTAQSLYETVKNSILPVWQKYGLDYTGDVVERAAGLCKNAFCKGKVSAPSHWESTLYGAYECGTLLNYETYKAALHEKIHDSYVAAHGLYIEKHCSNMVNGKMRLENLRSLRKFESSYIIEPDCSCADDIEAAFKSALGTCKSVSEIKNLMPETDNQIELAKGCIADLLNEELGSVSTMSEFTAKKEQYKVIVQDIDQRLQDEVNNHLKKAEERLREETRGTIREEIYSQIITPFSSRELTDQFTC